MVSITTDVLDQKVLEHFNGLVVKKDLVRKLKVGANVPAFVLEYLLANYCSTTDEEKLEEGRKNVKKILDKHYISPDQGKVVQAKLREKTKYKLIDKIEAELDSKKDKYWATLQNSNIKNANIDDSFINEHEKILTGGIWAIVDMEYDPEIKIGSTTYPFIVRNIQPIQLSTSKDEKVKQVRSDFSKEEWINLLLRSVGLEPKANDMDHRQRMLLVSRLIPLVENNFNMIELGPRQTGKSYVYREISPYAQLVSGGSATVPQLFVNNATGNIGMVGLWDTVAFDEVAGIKFKSKDGIQILKDYMESGSFSRGGSGELTGNAGIVFNGNVNTSISSLLKTSHLFEPLSEEMQDTAFIDRIHFYLPGWEIIKLSEDLFTNHFGFSVDFFSEFLKSLRRYSYADILEDYFSFGNHLQQRDTKAVKKTISGLIKLIHPDGQFTKEDVEEYLKLGMEMRRRVKEQLKRMGGMEFWNTNFSYFDRDTQEEVFVPVPEERGSTLIEPSPLKPGISYTVSVYEGELSLIRVEVSVADGNGKISVSGTSKQEVKQNIKNVHQYISSNERKLLPSDHSMKNYNIIVQLTSLIGKEIGSGIGSSVFLAILTALFKKSSKSALGVLGDLTVGGGVQRAEHFSDMVAMLSENGAHSILVPVENMQEISNIPQSLLGKTDLLFYPDTQKLLHKGIYEG